MEPFVQLTKEAGFSFFNNGGRGEGMLFPSHNHSAIEILYFTHGVHRIVCDNREFYAKEGDLIVIRSFATHEIYGESEGLHRHRALHISTGLLFNLSCESSGASYLLKLSESNTNAKCLWTKEECDKNGLGEAFKRLSDEHRSKKYGHDIACVSILSQILTTLLRETESQGIESTVSEDLKRRIYSSMIFLRSNFMYDISEETCAKNVSLSQYYFSRNFKAVTGRTFKEYLNLIRIENANILLKTTDKPVSEIAAACGFNSASHFIYTYKKSQNTTPLAFRNKNKR